MHGESDEDNFGSSSTASRKAVGVPGNACNDLCEQVTTFTVELPAAQEQSIEF